MRMERAGLTWWSEDVLPSQADLCTHWRVFTQELPFNAGIIYTPNEGWSGYICDDKPARFTIEVRPDGRRAFGNANNAAEKLAHELTMFMADLRQMALKEDV